jgi:hypothetical protein
MCHRSAEWSQKHIRTDCYFYILYDVTGVTGFILGVFDLQPGCAAPRSAIQGPAGTFIWRFLQAGCRKEYIHAQYIWCMAKIIIMTTLTISLWLELRGQTGDGKVCGIKHLLLGNYVKANWSFECILIILKFQTDVITYSSFMGIAGMDSDNELTLQVFWSLM